MFQFTDTVPNTKHSTGVNTCNFIILHHTAGGSYKSNLKRLSGNVVPGDTNPVSVQFVVGPNGECAKIGDPRDVDWHAGESERGPLQGMNRFAIGIETVGPDANGGFSDVQFAKVCDLVKYLMGAFHIPLENVLKHSDITNIHSKDKVLRDGICSARKTDISPRFRHDKGCKTYTEFRLKYLA